MAGFQVLLKTTSNVLVALIATLGAPSAEEHVGVHNSRWNSENSGLPGTSAKCWNAEYTFDRCCIRNDLACWGKEGSGDEQQGFSREMCCSAFFEEILNAGETRRIAFAPQESAVTAAPYSWGQGSRVELVRCINDAESGTDWEREHDSVRGPSEEGFPNICRNNMMRAVECVAQLPEIDVVLDLFLGGGCTAAAIAWWLGRKHNGSAPHARPSELFSFESHDAILQSAISGDGRIAVGDRVGWFSSEVLDVRGESGYSAMQNWLLDRSVRDKTEDGSSAVVGVQVLKGQPYPRGDKPWAQRPYVLNPLDVLCRHRAPVDLVLIDNSASAFSIENEWLIIETVCRPRWVILNNLNIHSGSSWIMQRLELLGNWHLELKGHFALYDKPWLGLQEIRRVRSWAVFSRRD